MILGLDFARPTCSFVRQWVEDHQPAVRLERVVEASKHFGILHQFVIDEDERYAVKFPGGKVRIGDASQLNDDVAGVVIFHQFTTSLNGVWIDILRPDVPRRPDHTAPQQCRLTLSASDIGHESAGVQAEPTGNVPQSLMLHALVRQVNSVENAQRVLFAMLGQLRPISMVASQFSKASRGSGLGLLHKPALTLNWLIYHCVYA